jgi:hypothetical protein
MDWEALTALAIDWDAREQLRHCYLYFMFQHVYYYHDTAAILFVLHNVVYNLHRLAQPRQLSFYTSTVSAGAGRAVRARAGSRAPKHYILQDLMRPD